MHVVATLMYVHCAPFTLCSRQLLASRLRLRQYNSHCLYCQAILPQLLTTVAYITAHNLTRANDVYMYKLLPSSSSSLHRSQQLKRCNCNFYFQQIDDLIERYFKNSANNFFSWENKLFVHFQAFNFYRLSCANWQNYFFSLGFRLT